MANDLININDTNKFDYVRDYLKSVNSNLDELSEKLDQIGANTSGELRSFYESKAAPVRAKINKLRGDANNTIGHINSALSFYYLADDRLMTSLNSIYDFIFDDYQTLDSNIPIAADGLSLSEKKKLVKDYIDGLTKVYKEVHEQYENLYGEGVLFDREKVNDMVHLFDALGLFDNMDPNGMYNGTELVFLKQDENGKNPTSNYKSDGDEQYLNPFVWNYFVSYSKETGAMEKLKAYFNEDKSWDESGLDKLLGDNLRQKWYEYSDCLVKEYDAELIFLYRYFGKKSTGNLDVVPWADKINDFDLYLKKQEIVNWEITNLEDFLDRWEEDQLYEWDESDFNLTYIPENMPKGVKPTSKEGLEYILKYLKETPVDDLVKYNPNVYHKQEMGKNGLWEDHEYIDKYWTFGNYTYDEGEMNGIKSQKYFSLIKDNDDFLENGPYYYDEIKDKEDFLKSFKGYIRNKKIFDTVDAVNEKVNDCLNLYTTEAVLGQGIYGMKQFDKLLPYFEEMKTEEYLEYLDKDYSDPKYLAGILHKEEIALYYYLKEHKSESIAKDYMKSMEDQINMRTGYLVASKYVELLNLGHAAADAARETCGIFGDIVGGFFDVEATIFGIGLSGIDGLNSGMYKFHKGLWNCVFADGKMGIDDYAFLYKAKLMSEKNDLNKNIPDVLRNVYYYNNQLCDRVGNIAVPVAAGVLITKFTGNADLGQKVARFLMGASTYGNTKESALIQGYTPGQANLYAGALALATSFIYGKLGKIPGIGSGNVANQLIQQTGLEYAKTLGTSAATQAGLTMVTSYLNMDLRNVILGEDRDFIKTTQTGLENALYSSLITIMSNVAVSAIGKHQMAKQSQNVSEPDKTPPGDTLKLKDVNDDNEIIGEKPSETKPESGSNSQPEEWFPTKPNNPNPDSGSSSGGWSGGYTSTKSSSVMEYNDEPPGGDGYYVNESQQAIDGNGNAQTIVNRVWVSTSKNSSTQGSIQQGYNLYATRGIQQDYNEVCEVLQLIEDGDESAKALLQTPLFQQKFWNVYNYLDQVSNSNQNTATVNVEIPSVETATVPNVQLANSVPPVADTPSVMPEPGISLAAYYPQGMETNASNNSTSSTNGEEVSLETNSNGTKVDLKTVTANLREKGLIGNRPSDKKTGVKIENDEDANLTSEIPITPEIDLTKVALKPTERVAAFMKGDVKEDADYSIVEEMDTSKTLKSIATKYIEIAPTEKAQEAVSDIILKGSYKGLKFDTGECTPNNPRVETARRLAMANLYVTNPETVETLAQDGISLFHGTRSDNLESIIQNGLMSAKEIEKQGGKVTTGEYGDMKTIMEEGHDFISFTDNFDDAYTYTGPPKGDSFGVIVGTTKKAIDASRKLPVHSDIVEVGVKDKFDGEMVLLVPGSKLDYVKGLVGKKDIKVLSMEGYENKGYRGSYDWGDYEENEKGFDALTERVKQMAKSKFDNPKAQSTTKEETPVAHTLKDLSSNEFLVSYSPKEFDMFSGEYHYNAIGLYDYLKKQGRIPEGVTAADFVSGIAIGGVEGKVLNTGAVVEPENITDPAQAAKEFSEGNGLLEKVLLNAWDKNYKTHACCSGDEGEAYVSFKLNTEQDFKLFEEMIDKLSGKSGPYEITNFGDQFAVYSGKTDPNKFFTDINDLLDGKYVKKIASKRNNFTKTDYYDEILPEGHSLFINGYTGEMVLANKDKSVTIPLTPDIPEVAIKNAITGLNSTTDVTSEFKGAIEDIKKSTGIDISNISRGQNSDYVIMTENGPLTFKLENPSEINIHDIATKKIKEVCGVKVDESNTSKLSSSIENFDFDNFDFNEDDIDWDLPTDELAQKDTTDTLETDAMPKYSLDEKNNIINEYSKSQFMDFLENDTTGEVLELFDDDGCKILQKSKLVTERLRYILTYSKYKNELLQNDAFLSILLNTDVDDYYAVMGGLSFETYDRILNECVEKNKNNESKKLFSFFSEEYKLKALDNWAYSTDLLYEAFKTYDEKVMIKILDNYDIDLLSHDIDLRMLFERAKYSVLKAQENRYKSENGDSEISIPIDKITTQMAQKIWELYDLFKVRNIISDASYSTDVSVLNDYVKEQEESILKFAVENGLTEQFLSIYKAYGELSLIDHDSDEYFQKYHEVRMLINKTGYIGLFNELEEQYKIGGIESVQKYIQILNNNSLSNFIIDYHFEENYYNIMLDIKELLNFYYSGNVNIPLDRVELYQKIANIDSLSIQEMFDLHNELKKQNIMEQFYDDMELSRRIVGEAIRDYSLDSETIKQYRNDELSQKYGVDVYTVDNNPFFAIVKTGRHATDNLPTGHSYSLIGYGGIAVYGDVKNSNTYLYDASDLNPQQLVHVFPYDSFTLYRPFEHSEKGSNSVNLLMMPDELMANSKGYNEMLILERGKAELGIEESIPELKKMALYCIDNITEENIEVAKKQGLGIFLIDSKNYYKQEQMPDNIYRHNISDFINYTYYDELSKERLEKIRRMSQIEDFKVIDVSKIDTTEHTPNARGIDPNLTNMSYRDYDFVYKANNGSNVATVVNKIVEDSKSGEILLEVDNTIGITQDILKQLPPNVKIRVLGDYVPENFVTFKSNKSALHSLENVTYTNNQMKKIIKVLDEFDSGVDPNWDDVARARYAFDFMQKIRYRGFHQDGESGNGTRPSHFDGLMNLVHLKSTCQGYTHTYKELLTRINVPCLEVAGQLDGTGQHAFNIVTLKGKNVIVDTTRSKFADYYVDLLYHPELIEFGPETIYDRQKILDEIDKIQKKYHGDGFGVDDISQYTLKNHKDLASTITTLHDDVPNNSFGLPNDVFTKLSTLINDDTFINLTVEEQKDIISEIVDYDSLPADIKLAIFTTLLENSASKQGLTVKELGQLTGEGIVDSEIIDKANEYALNIAVNAEKEEPVITEIMKGYEDDNCILAGLETKLKDPESISRKLIKESKKNNISVKEAIDKVTDSVRYSVVIDPSEYIDKSIAVLKDLIGKGYEIVKLSNTWDSDQYKGLNAIFKTKNGTLFEVQFHTPDSYTIKNCDTHLFYEVIRNDFTSEHDKALGRELQSILNDTIDVPKGVIGFDFSKELNNDDANNMVNSIVDKAYNIFYDSNSPMKKSLKNLKKLSKKKGYNVEVNYNGSKTNMYDVILSLGLYAFDSNEFEKLASKDSLTPQEFLNYGIQNNYFMDEDIEKLKGLDDYQRIVNNPDVELRYIDSIMLENMIDAVNKYGVSGIYIPQFEYISFLMYLVSRDATFRVNNSFYLQSIASKLGDITQKIIESKGTMEYNYNGIKIAAYGEDKEFLSKAIYRTVNSIGRLPLPLAQQLRYIDKIKIYDSQNPRNMQSLLKYYLSNPKEKYFMSYGSYSPNDANIFMYKNVFKYSSDDDLLCTLGHEAAHFLDMYIGRVVMQENNYFTKIFDIWKGAKAYDKNSVSEYGETNLTEDFAVMNELFIKSELGQIDKDKVSKEFSSRLRVLDNIYAIRKAIYDGVDTVPLIKRLDALRMFDTKVGSMTILARALFGKELINYYYSLPCNKKIELAQNMKNHGVSNQFIHLFINKEFLADFSSNQLVDLVEVYRGTEFESLVLSNIFFMINKINPTAIEALEKLKNGDGKWNAFIIDQICGNIAYNRDIMDSYSDLCFMRNSISNGSDNDVYREVLRIIFNNSE